MKIVLATGIYPPAIGGPAQFTKNLANEFEHQGHRVKILTYRLEQHLPTGLRHVWFFIRTLLALPGADLILALDTFSVGLPAVLAAKIVRKKIIIRVGGDFLWEGYVERTSDLVLLREFYQKSLTNLSLKEKLIFRLVRWTLNNADVLAFNSLWQQQIFLKPYNLVRNHCHLIENYYAGPEKGNEPTRTNFIGTTRKLKWKNWGLLQRAFSSAQKLASAIELDLETLPYGQFLEKIKSAYAIILVSLGDISPNLVADALRFGKPVILTQETGLRERVGESVLWVDPRNESEITEKIIWLSKKDNYLKACQKAREFTHAHSWSAIATEFISLANSL